MYVRLNARTHTPFGLGRVEVAFDTVNQFLQANRYAGKLASNAVVQYALWLDEATPTEHERLIRWWQDEVEGTGQVPILSSETKPEVLRFAGGTDADLRLQWQEFLMRVIATAFDLPPMFLGSCGGCEPVDGGGAERAGVPDGGAAGGEPACRAHDQGCAGEGAGAGRCGVRLYRRRRRTRWRRRSFRLQLLQAGVLTVNEVRMQAGDAPLPDEQRAES